jgi:nitroreductase
MLVDDETVRNRLAPLYADSVDQLWKTIYAPQIEAASRDPESAESQQFLKVQRSAQWLGDHFAEIPLLLFPFCQYDPTGGSIYPAVWSAMLAARSEGVGSCLTVVMGVFHLEETLEILGVPTDEGWVLSGCVTFGYPTGRWGVAPRQPVDHVSYRNTWGGSVGFEVPEPLWPAKD